MTSNRSNIFGSCSLYSRVSEIVNIYSLPYLFTLCMFPRTPLCDTCIYIYTACFLYSLSLLSIDATYRTIHAIHRPKPTHPHPHPHPTIIINPSKMCKIKLLYFPKCGHVTGRNVSDRCPGAYESYTNEKDFTEHLPKQECSDPFKRVQELVMREDYCQDCRKEREEKEKEKQKEKQKEE